MEEESIRAIEHDRECKGCGAVGFMERLEDDDGETFYLCECGHEES